MENTTAYIFGAACWSTIAFIAASIYYEAQEARQRRKHREEIRTASDEAWSAGIERDQFREAYQEELHRANQAAEKEARAYELAEWRRQDIAAICHSYDKACNQVRATREALRRSNAVARDARARAAQASTGQEAQQQLKELRQAVNTYINAREAGTSYQPTLGELRTAANPTAESRAFQRQLAQQWKTAEEQSRRAQREARAQAARPQEGPSAAPGARVAAGEGESTGEAGEGQQGGQIPLSEGAPQGGPVRAEE